MTGRGVAMVFVLGVLVVLLTATAGIAGSRMRAATVWRSAGSLELGLGVAEAAEGAILAWLDGASGGAVADSDLFPSVGLLDDRVVIGGAEWRVRVTAWDQLGMLARDRRVSSAVPEGIMRAGEFGAFCVMVSPGLDRLRAGEPVYPCPDHPGRLGGVFATHHPSASRPARSASRLAVNVNTAPRWLLERFIDDGEVVDAFLSARGREGSDGAAGLGAAANGAVRFVGSSWVWSFRVDVESVRARVSVWLVYVEVGGAWVREQRLVIDR